LRSEPVSEIDRSGTTAPPRKASIPDAIVIVLDTADSLASSRLLHPDLHRFFAGPLGSPFGAGIPCRTTLVVYSDRRALKQRIGRRLRKDHAASAYPITPHPFLVTRDGIAPAVEK
jgi:hypothetical protein